MLGSTAAEGAWGSGWDNLQDAAQGFPWVPGVSKPFASSDSGGQISSGSDVGTHANTNAGTKEGVSAGSGGIDPKCLKDKEPVIARELNKRFGLNLTADDVKNAIHALKEEVPGNPDVIVDVCTGDVYINKGGGKVSGDPWDNIMDWLRAGT